MLLDPFSAKALFVIILSTCQGADRVNSQLPLHVTDRGENWLVTGTPYTDNEIKTNFTMCHMFVAKRTAEIKGINCHGRMMLTREEQVYWSHFMTPRQYAGVFGPATDFEPTGIMDIWFALYGGLVNTPSAAVDYAVVLMRTRPAWVNVSPGDLRATERDKVWHVTGPRFGPGDLLTISRSTGALLSGAL